MSEFFSAVICERLKNVVADVRTRIIMLPSPAKIEPLSVSIVVSISIVKLLSMSRMPFDSSPQVPNKVRIQIRHQYQPAGMPLSNMAIGAKGNSQKIGVPINPYFENRPTNH